MDKAKILIVDSKDGLERYFSDFVSEKDYDIDQTSSAEQALKIMATSPPHLVITDMGMIPNGDRVLSLAQQFNASFICASSCKNAGNFSLPDSVRVLNKPFRLIDLQIAIRSVMASRTDLR